MSKRDVLQVLSSQLFLPEMSTYAVLDGASIPGLLHKLHEWRPQHICLYRGELAPDIAEVAPYLVYLEPNAEMTKWIFKQGWGQHWGIFALVDMDVDLKTLRKHFRKFLMVESPDGKPIYFRYYDPRVMRTYLPNCNNDELATVFGPVQIYVMENTDGISIEQFYAPKDAGNPLPSLKIRPEQMKEFNEHVSLQFENNMLDYLQEEYPQEAKFYSSEELRQLVKSGIEKAVSYGITIKRDAADYITLMLLHGADFEHLPQNQWALEILEDEDMAGGTKILQLETAFAKLEMPNDSLNTKKVAS